MYYFLEKGLKVADVIFRHTVKVETVMDCRISNTNKGLAEAGEIMLHNRQQNFLIKGPY
jgi:hypothetical protein